MYRKRQQKIDFNRKLGQNCCWGCGAHHDMLQYPCVWLLLRLELILSSNANMRGKIVFFFCFSILYSKHLTDSTVPLNVSKETNFCYFLSPCSKAQIAVQGTPVAHSS